MHTTTPTHPAPGPSRLAGVLLKPPVPIGSWVRRASCASARLDVFFPAYGKSAGAKRICAGCPVREECLAYALDSGEEFGVWGGLDEAERKSLVRRRRRTAAKGAVA